jgi:hypothetical protein
LALEFKRESRYVEAISIGPGGSQDAIAIPSRLRWITIRAMRFGSCGQPDSSGRCALHFQHRSKVSETLSAQFEQVQVLASFFLAKEPHIDGLAGHVFSAGIQTGRPLGPAGVPGHNSHNCQHSTSNEKGKLLPYLELRNPVIWQHAFSCG